MIQVFKNNNDHEKFSRVGFLRKKLLDLSLTNQLKDLYHQKFPSGSHNFYSSTFLSNIEEKKALNNELISILEPAIQPLFSDYKLLGAQFLVKNPGEKGFMPFHQDWTVVDEEKHRSITVWFALDATNENNGAIKVIPYSHEFSRQKRGPGNFDLLSDIQNTLNEYSHTLLMDEGEAFIFDQSIIHGSAENTTNKPRIAVALGLVYKEADLFFYHRNTENSFQKYSVPNDFFITFLNDGNAPQEGKLIEELEQNYVKVLEKEFTSKISQLQDNSFKNFQSEFLFKNAETQKYFDTYGYVKIPLLEANEVETLKKYYLSLNHDHVKDYGFHISLENENDDYRTGVFEKLFSTIMPKLDPQLNNYQAFTASYVIKDAGLQNIVPPHQDWSFVDETEFVSATVWVALMDVNKNNGALGIIRGSHKIFNDARSSPSPQSKSILSDHVFTLFPFVEVIDMKAGEALIFNNKTIHASPPNISGVNRIAAGIGITNKEAQLRHYYQTPGKEKNIEVYEVDPKFFPNYNNSKMSGYFSRGEKPQNLKVIESFKKISPEFSREEMVGLVTQTPGVKFNEELMKELAEMYNYNMDGTKKQVAPLQEVIIEPELVGVVEPAPKKTFFQTYTPANILAEIKYRLKKN